MTSVVRENRISWQTNQNCIGVPSYNGHEFQTYIVSPKGGPHQPVAAPSAAHCITRSKFVKEALWEKLKIPQIIHFCGTSEGGFPYIDTWARANPGWDIKKLINVSDVVKGLFPDTVDLSELLLPVEMADIARLVALQQDGGFYANNDVIDKVPIESCLSMFNYPSDVDMVLGVEFPRKMDGTPI